LTYAQKTADDIEPPSPMRGKRATIFTSAEIGVKQIKIPPFPPDILGTYSCHGIEPATNAAGDEDIVNDKTNQDRGCVVNPFRGSPSETLLMVLDGHGEHGDRVSEFVMRQVQSLNHCSLQ
jgi:hypothetical protein